MPVDYITPLISAGVGLLTSLMGGSLRGSSSADGQNLDMAAIQRAEDEDRMRREEQYQNERREDHAQLLRLIRDLTEQGAVERQRLEQEYRQQQQNMAAEQAAWMQRREEEFTQQRERDNALFQQRYMEMQNATAAERQRMQDDFRREQQRLDDVRRAETENREREFQMQRERDALALQEKLGVLRSDAAREQQRMEEDFQGRQRCLEEQWTEDKARHEERLAAMKESMQEAQERVRVLTEQLEKPVKDREEKLAFVNGLQLPILQTNSLLLVGPKGTGKSTFLWLLGKGQIPKRTIRDGTVEIIQLPGFIDSIGLRGWTVEEMLKLLVLMIYEGLPQDVIVFGNDRIDLPVTTLGLLGVSNPMIVIMSSEFWKMYQPPNGRPPKLHLTETSYGVRRVQPESDLDFVYNFPAYNDIKQLQLGTPITHHDDIDGLVRNRQYAGVRPFQILQQKLGGGFTTAMQNDYHTEAIFRFIYIYEKKYGKNKLQFMNHATLQDFV